MTTATKEDLARLEQKIDLLLSVLCPQPSIVDELRIVEASGGNKVEHLRQKFNKEGRKVK